MKLTSNFKAHYLINNINNNNNNNIYKLINYYFMLYLKIEENKTEFDSTYCTVFQLVFFY